MAVAALSSDLDVSLVEAICHAKTEKEVAHLVLDYLIDRYQPDIPLEKAKDTLVLAVRMFRER